MNSRARSFISSVYTSSHFYGVAYVGRTTHLNQNYVCVFLRLFFVTCDVFVCGRHSPHPLLPASHSVLSSFPIPAAHVLNLAYACVAFLKVLSPNLLFPKTQFLTEHQAVK